MFSLKSVKNTVRFTVGAVVTASDALSRLSITDKVLEGTKVAFDAVKSIDIKATKVAVGTFLDESAVYFEQSIADAKTRSIAKTEEKKESDDKSSVFTAMSTSTLRLMLGYKTQCSLADIPQLSREEMIVQLMELAVAELEAEEASTE